jgi:alkyldihydroxyacetonephosphate synthase
MRWNRWGVEERRHPLGEGALDTLRELVGDAEPYEPVSLEEVKMPRRRRLPDAVVKAAGGGDAVLSEREVRARHSAGRSYPDLLRLRTGELGVAPDAVVRPPDPGSVAALLEACSKADVAVVPFGGGTSVVGGVDPLRNGHKAVLTLDLSALRSIEVDATSQVARLGPGWLAPDAERVLNARGFTIGHFPQSFEHATIGGFAATRSAGQASSGYGRFDKLVTALTMLTPVGELRTLDTPHTAAGPSLREVALGSEGTLGVITDVAVQLRRAPRESRHEGWLAPDFESGCEIVRAMAQSNVLPDVLRLSDRDETTVSLALGGEGLARKVLGTLMSVGRYSGGSIMICGWDGDRESVGRRRALAARVLRRGGAMPLGRAAGEAWKRGRYDGPYFREELLDRGYFVETLETSHTWSRLGHHYEAVSGALRSALEAQGTPGLVYCHVSHAYRDGASLYFTFVAPRRTGGELEQWRAVKTAACEAIVAAGGTITHHHAVGRDHAPYMPAEVGDAGIEALHALKDRLDPAGIMNPGKLLP